MGLLEVGGTVTAQVNNETPCFSLFHCFPFFSQLVVFFLQIIARLITDDQATLDQIRVMGMTHAEVDMSQSEIASLW